MTNPSQELCLVDAAEYLPKRRGKSVSVRTIDRWIKIGCRGVKLDAWKRGGIWFTSTEALERFADECTPRPAPTIMLPTSRQQKASIAAAVESLRKSGFYGKRAK